jgi:hypothetical protein
MPRLGKDKVKRLPGFARRPVIPAWRRSAGSLTTVDPGSRPTALPEKDPLAVNRSCLEPPSSGRQNRITAWCTLPFSLPHDRSPDISSGRAANGPCRRSRSERAARNADGRRILQYCSISFGGRSASVLALALESALILTGRKFIMRTFMISAASVVVLAFSGSAFAQ